MPRKPPVNWAQIDEGKLRKLVEDGESYRNIGFLLGVSDSTAKTRAVRLGLKSKHTSGRGSPFWTEERIARVKELCTSDKPMTWEDIGKEIGSHPDRVRNFASRIGLFKQHAFKPGSSHQWEKWEDDILLKMVGKPWSDMARATGRTAKACQERLKRIRGELGLATTPQSAIKKAVLQVKPKVRPCIGALCTSGDQPRRMSEPGQWMCKTCRYHCNTVHGGYV